VTKSKSFEEDAALALRGRTLLRRRDAVEIHCGISVVFE
jgi:hypothetical protein